MPEPDTSIILVWKSDPGLVFSSPPYLIPYDNAVRFPWGPVNHKGDGGPSCEENSKVKMAYRTSKDERVELGVVHKK